ncbi:MAG: 3-hydroxyacyl-CoA dehydrogenase/enoyl-CoA hydratase family protein [Deltaproteobacteria bacterium]|nr:3-hydroxyacyl-CoA dehydrogenase/enoyl-CoA hydratase family protein [Deltaproteobacteria bacterium]
MAREIKKVAVLGAGIMGAGIAAHLAGAGIPCLLLDIVPKDLPAGGDRNQFAKKGLENILNAKPALIFSKSDAKLIQLGNFEDDFDRLKECDWIIEVVVERLEIKRSVFEKVEKVMKPDAIVSSNTSGLSLASMSEGRSVHFKKNFLITHFFNPVRYMKLVEIVSGPETNGEVTCFVSGFLSRTLGKGVVYAKDTPNFVANRIGVYGWCSALQHILKGNYTVEEADKILGTAVGRPKSAMFRTADMVGLDTLVHVAKHTYEACPDDEQRQVYKLPAVIETMLEKKLLGDKTGAGFFKKTKTATGKEILALDLQTAEYRPQTKVKYDSLGAAKGIEDSGERLRMMVAAQDRAGELAWRTTADLLVYAANRIPEIADDIVNIDNGMKWGFNWGSGPFETWDILGVKEVAERLKKEGVAIPKLVQEVLTKGEGKFYKKVDGKKYYYDLKTSSYQPVTERPEIIVLASLKERQKVVKKNDSASLIDLGDGVACLEFHSKMNAIDDEIVAMMQASLEEVNKNFVGLVIANQAENFSVGANLMLLWLEAQQQNWDTIKQVVQGFQSAAMALKYAPKPVVSVPFGMTFGGGCEAAMGATQMRAHAELYMGLVEVGVGLIPAGGGCKEMLLRCEESTRKQFSKIPPSNRWAKDIDGGPFPKAQMAFQTVAFAKVSMSAKEARELHYLKDADRISLSRDHLIHDAKQDVLELAKNFVPAKPRDAILVAGGGGFYALKSAIQGFRLQGIISEHDAVIAEKLARIFTGGDMPNMGTVTEQKLLDLELESFLSLVGMEKSQARMQNMLMTGKPLRN